MLNGVGISGSNPVVEPNPNSDYDGSTGAPLPLLWDNEAHDITGVPVTDPATGLLDLNVVVNASSTSGFFDCLVTVAHVVASSP